LQRDRYRKRDRIHRWFPALRQHHTRPDDENHRSGNPKGTEPDPPPSVVTFLRPQAGQHCRSRAVGIDPCGPIRTKLPGEFFDSAFVNRHRSISLRITFPARPSIA
jgi:hypothetical protein